MSSKDEIELEADVDNNNTGSISQTNGTIGSGSEELLLWSAQGIGTEAQPLQTNISKLQAATYYGNVYIANSGDLTLANLDGTTIADLTGNPDDPDDFYSIASGGDGVISISATGGILTESYWNGESWEGIEAIATLDSDIILLNAVMPSVFLRPVNNKNLTYRASLSFNE